MSELAIVAIPTQDDYVWKISSEKVPHLTLMMLGDSDNPELANIEEFLAHVVKTSMQRFGLDVDRRGLLGEQDADVLFFKNPGYNVKNLELVRSYLLTNQSVARAYRSTEQFDKWTPHLTLGYPDSPAKKIDRDWPITWVTFDRIALWTGDYEGPEFRLLDDHMDEPLAMGDADADSLKHYGVKGMKWGQHKKTAGEAVKLVGTARKLKKDPTKAAAQTKAREVGGLHKVGDKELQAMLTRMEMERKYKNFMNEEAKRRNEGLKATAKILGQVGKVAVPIVLGVVANRVAKNMSNTTYTNATVGRVIDGVSRSTDLARQ